MNVRQAIAVLSLVGLLLSTYLTLWKLGMVGEMSCGVGGCETVQLSRWGDIFGIPVSVVGMLGYGALFGVAVYAADNARHSVRVARVLNGLAAAGLLFTGYLVALQALVIDAWCRWCLVSAAIVSTIFALSLVQLKGSRG